MSYHIDCSGSWIRELFKNVVINYQITYLSGLVDLLSLKGKEEKRERLTKKILRRGEFAYVNSPTIKNEFSNPREENDSWSSEYGLQLPGDS